MTTLDELLHEHASLTTVRVERWVARGLLRPGGTGDTWVFETVEMVIGLIDQVHTLRSQLDLVGRVIAEQPAPAREAIAAALARLAKR